MKRIVSIGLLFLLMFQAAGSLALFRLMQSGIRYEVKGYIKTGIEPHLLVELIIPTDPAVAEEMGYEFEGRREIIFNGHYYDIVSRETQGDHTRYICYKDDKESDLAKDMTESRHPAGQEQSALATHLLQLTLASYITDFWIGPGVLPEGPQNSPDSTYYFSLITWVGSIPGPPPWSIV
jgi:hypothetical protein